MRPAFSVVLFTTLSGAGYGLLCWMCLWLFMGYVEGYRMYGKMIDFLTLGIAIGYFLVSIGLISSMFHLGKSGRAWRAFSQWRTSWLSREAVAAVLTYIPGAILIGLLLFIMYDNGDSSPLRTLLLPILAALIIIGSIATLTCTAMIYASLKPIPAWRHKLVVPVYFAFAMLTGFSLFAALISWRYKDNGLLLPFSWQLIVFAIFALALKLLYWRDMDKGLMDVESKAQAVGLPERQVSNFEQPHTEANYVLKEMAFEFARANIRILRVASIILFAGFPILLAMFAAMAPHVARAALPMAALFILIGTFVERWLFFAEAKHQVTAYY